MQTTAVSTATIPEQQTGQLMRILVLDDSEIDRQRLIRLCRKAGLAFQPTEAASLAEMRKALDETEFDLVFIDYLLVGEDGLEAVDILMAHPNQKAASIMIAGEGRLDVAVEAMRRGCSDYVTKQDISVEALQKSIATSVERRMLGAALEEERAQRLLLERTVRFYANACSADMRSILAATLRRVRKLRHHGTDDGFAADLGQVEAQIDLLWNALPTFGEACETALTDKPRLPGPAAD